MWSQDKVVVRMCRVMWGSDRYRKWKCRRIRRCEVYCRMADGYWLPVSAIQAPAIMGGPGTGSPRSSGRLRRRQNPVYHYHLGLAFAKADDEAKARAALKRALSLKPDFAGASDARAKLAALNSSAAGSF